MAGAEIKVNMDDWPRPSSRRLQAVDAMVANAIMHGRHAAMALAMQDHKSYLARRWLQAQVLTAL